jgi:hypothetical protein
LISNRIENREGVELTGRKATNEIKDEPGEPMVARSKMGEAAVSELEVKGIENLTLTEKKHLLLQLARDRVKDSSAGPWEIVDVFREEWRAVKDTLAQSVEINLRDVGRGSLFRVLLDITQFERQLEIQEQE